MSALHQYRGSFAVVRKLVQMFGNLQLFIHDTGTSCVDERPF